MAESAGEKSFEATPHRRQEAREQGQVVYSQDLASAAMLMLGAVLITFVGIGVVLAHESRTVGDYEFVVGFIDEPVYTGQKSGLEVMVAQGDTPVEGLEGNRGHSLLRRKIHD